MTHDQYLERYHEESEALRRELNTYLGRLQEGDLEEAKGALERWDRRVDALWSQVQAHT